MEALIFAAPVEGDDEWPEYIEEIIAVGNVEREGIEIRFVPLEDEDGHVRVLLARGYYPSSLVNRRHAQLCRSHAASVPAIAGFECACGECDDARRFLVDEGVIAT